MAKITPETTIREVLDINPNLAAVLKADGMDCMSCQDAAGESLELAALIHNVDLKALITRLNILADALEKV